MHCFPLFRERPKCFHSQKDQVEKAPKISGKRLLKIVERSTELCGVCETKLVTIVCGNKNIDESKIWGKLLVLFGTFWENWEENFLGEKIEKKQKKR
jgi:hypothetical protein